MLFFFFSPLILPIDRYHRCAKEEEVVGNDGHPIIRDQGHNGWFLKDFSEQSQCIEAGLTKAEVLALRLYTSCAFASINGPLRSRATQVSIVIL